MSLEKRAIKGTIASVVALVVQLGLQIVSVPVLLEHWGEEEYGVWLAINSLYGLLITIDGGHQHYVGNELLQQVPIGVAPAKKTLQAGVAGAGVTAALELVVVTVLAFTGLLVGLAGVSNQRTLDVWICVGVLLMAWVSVGTIGQLISRLYPATGEYARGVWINIVQRTSVGLAPVVVAASGGGIRLAAVMSAAATAFIGVFIFYDLRRFHAYRPFFAPPDWSLVTRNLVRSVSLTATAFVSQAQQHFFLLVVAGGLGGMAALPALTTLRTMANVFVQGASTITIPLLPDLMRLRAEGELAKLELALRAISGFSSWLLGSAVMFAMPLLPAVHSAWTRGHTPFHSALYALLAAAVLVRVFGSPPMALLTGLNALWSQFATAALQGILTVGAAALLVRHDGLRGAGLAILIGEIVGSAVVPFLSLRWSEPKLAALVTPKGSFTAASFPLLTLSLLLAHAYWGLSVGWLCALGSVGALTAVVPLWRTLPDSMRSRLWRLAGR